MRRSALQRGFSLIEMAIVLVVIALLAGGIFMASSLIRQSEMRAVTGEIDRYTRGVQIFLDKFGQFPGDLTNATTYWGAAGVCPNVGTGAAPGSPTCNGDGDGTIGECCFDKTYEWYTAWQHLANAGIIEDKMSGQEQHTLPQNILGTSVPASLYPGGGYTLLHSFNESGDNEYFPHPAAHWLHFGAIAPACNGGGADDCITQYQLLTPKEALQLDQKLDDGKPGTGKMLAHPSSSAINPNCSDGDDSFTSAYNTAYEQAACGLMYDTGY